MLRFVHLSLFSLPGSSNDDIFNGYRIAPLWSSYDDFLKLKKINLLKKQFVTLFLNRFLKSFYQVKGNFKAIPTIYILHLNYLFSYKKI